MEDNEQTKNNNGNDILEFFLTLFHAIEEFINPGICH